METRVNADSKSKRLVEQLLSWQENVIFAVFQNKIEAICARQVDTKYVVKRPFPENYSQIKSLMTMTKGYMDYAIDVLPSKELENV